MANGFLVLMPYERLHATISILKQRPELPTNVCKVRAVKDVMLLSAYRMCIAQRAAGPLALQACHVPQAKNGSPTGIASIIATWKEAWG